MRPGLDRAPLLSSKVRSRAHLVPYLASRFQMTREEARVLLDAVCATIGEALETDDRVEVGGLGAFVVRTHPACTRFSLKTRTKEEAPERREVTFVFTQRVRTLRAGPSRPGANRIPAANLCGVSLPPRA